MGISYPVPLSVVEYGNTHQLNSTTLSTVASDFELNPIFIPSWLRGKIERGYLDVYFPFVENTSANENHVQSTTYWKVSSDDVTYTNATSMNDQTFSLPGNTVFTGLIRRVGNIDIKSTLDSAVTSGYLYIKWVNAQTHWDSMVFRLSYAIVRIFTKG